MQFTKRIQQLNPGSRWTVLRPLAWLVGILAALVLAAIRFRAPNWMAAILVAFHALGVSLYLGAYAYCLLTDKDALHTEGYSMAKLALEKGRSREATPQNAGERV